MYLRFCKIFLCVVAVSFFMTVELNYCVDPYDAWFTCRMPGVNMLSPASDRMERVAKPITYANLNPKPKVVFIGASQILWGMDTEYYQERDGRSAYNMAMPGMTAYEAYKYAHHVLETDSEIEEIILGIDFGMLVATDKSNIPLFMGGFDETSIGESGMPERGLMQTLLSFQAVKDSIKKLYANAETEWIFFFHKPVGDLSDEAILFLLKEADASFDYSLVQLQHQSRVVDGYVNEQGLEYIDKINSECKERRVKLTVFIPPVHAHQLLLQSFASEAYEEAIKKLVNITDVMDFTAYNQFTMSEAMEGMIDENTNPYFWDVLHMKKTYGRKVIDSILDNTSNSEICAVHLTPYNINEHMLYLIKQNHIWKIQHPEVVEEIVLSGQVD